jgi:hypothetical protein
MAITAYGQDKQAFKLTGITSGGGTATASVPIPTDTICVLQAKVVMVHSTGGHLDHGAGLWAEYVVYNANGTLTAPGAITSGNNPANNTTTTFVAAHAQGSDINSIGGANPTAAWTISGTNAVLTVTNNYTAAVDAVVYVDIYPAKNV